MQRKMARHDGLQFPDCYDAIKKAIHPKAKRESVSCACPPRPRVWWLSTTHPYYLNCFCNPDLAETIFYVEAEADSRDVTRMDCHDTGLGLKLRSHAQPCPSLCSSGQAPSSPAASKTLQPKGCCWSRAIGHFRAALMKATQKSKVDEKEQAHKMFKSCNTTTANKLSNVTVK